MPRNTPDDVMNFSATVAQNSSLASTKKTPKAFPFVIRSIVAFGKDAEGNNLPADPATGTSPTMEDIEVEIKIGGNALFANKVPLSTFSQRGALRHALDVPVIVPANAEVEVTFHNTRISGDPLTPRLQLWGYGTEGNTLEA